MNCNCNNNGSSTTAPKIKHVYGNVLKLAIPLTLRTIEIVDEVVEYTDTDFIPSNEYPVVVVFSKDAVKIKVEAIMSNGNIACVEDYGTIPVGTYDITITCKDAQGNPYRFNQKTMLKVVSATIDAGIETPIEYEATTWYLDAALFLSMRGQDGEDGNDGVGILDISVEESDEVGGTNYVTFLLTDGRSRTFSIKNGSGMVENVFDVNSPYPIANGTVAAKFNQIDNTIAGLFGDADYDTTTKRIRFWNKNKTTLLTTIDARPFVKDGMVNNVYISNGTLVITFNTDSGREAIAVSLSSIFNPNNYYTRLQVDNLLSNYALAITTNSNFANIRFQLENKASLNDDGRIDYPTLPPVLLDGINQTISLVPSLSELGLVYHTTDNKIAHAIREVISTNPIRYQYLWVLYTPDNNAIYYNLDDNKFYRCFEGEMVELEIDGTGGGSITQEQADWNESDSTDPAYIKNKPTIPVVPTNVSSFANDAGYKTSQSTVLDMEYDENDHLVFTDANGSELTHAQVLAMFEDKNLEVILNYDVVGDGAKFRCHLMAEIDGGYYYQCDAPNWDGDFYQFCLVDDGEIVIDEMLDIPLPAAQIPADWNQTNQYAKDYIKNKPTIPTIPTNVSTFNNDAGYLTKQRTVVRLIVTEENDEEVLTFKDTSNNVISHSDFLAMLQVSSAKNLVLLYDDEDDDILYQFYFYYPEEGGYYHFVAIPTSGYRYIELVLYLDDVTFILDSYDKGTFSYDNLPDKPSIPNVLYGKYDSRDGFHTGTYNPVNSSWAYAMSVVTPAVNTLYIDVNSKVTYVYTGSAFVRLDEESGGSGTVTSVTMNGSSISPNNGVIDLGTVVTSHQSLSGKQDTLVSGTNIKTVNGSSILGSGDLTVASVDATVVQNTGNSTTSVMSQKAVTDAIVDESGVRIERGTSVQFPDVEYYTKLDATQVAAINATDTITLVFMMKGLEGGVGDQDNRYIGIGAATSGNLMLIGNVYGDIITNGESASQAGNGISKILINKIINPLVCALVCDRVKGTMAFYCGNTKMGERTFANYQMEKFVADSGLLMFDGGSQKAKCYGFQIYDFDATGVLGEYLATAEKTEITQNAKSSYGADNSWVTQNTRNNQSTYTVATAGDQYVYYNVANTGWLYKLTITVDVSFKITTMGSLPVYSKVFDSNGDKIYDQNIKGTTFTSGTYKFFFYGLSYIIVQTQADNGTITVVESLKRRCGCITNFRFDTVYDGNKIFDDASGKFHEFYTDSACTTAADLVSSSVPARSVYTLGNLGQPHFVGEIKIYNGDVYIANDNWAWKKINNS